MTTEQLIEFLKLHPGKRVFVDGYEGGVDLLMENQCVMETVAEKDYEPGYCGTHDIVDANELPDHYYKPNSKEIVVILGR